MFQLLPLLFIGLAESDLTSGPAIGCLEETGLCVMARASDQERLELRVLGVFGLVGEVAVTQ